MSRKRIPTASALAVLAAGSVAAGLLFLASTSAATSSDCTITPSSQVAPPSAGTAQAPKQVTLTPADDSKVLTWNFGADRDEISWPVTIKAAPDLAGVSASAIEITANPLTRADKHKRFPRLQVTAPRISGDQQRLTFTVCANPGGASPGSYSGSIQVDGPPGFTGATVNATLTLKATHGVFGLAALIAFLVALGVLELKSVADYKKSEIENEHKPKPTFKVWDALTYNWRSPSGVVTSVIGLGAALLSVYWVYKKTETWGSDLVPDLLAVAQGALAAVGVQGGAQGLLDLVTRGGTTSKG